MELNFGGVRGGASRREELDYVIFLPQSTIHQLVVARKETYKHINTVIYHY